MRLALLLGLIYLISEVLLTITRRGRSKAGEKQDRSTLRVIWIVILASIAAGMFVARSTSPTTGSNSMFVLPYADQFAMVG